VSPVFSEPDGGRVLRMRAQTPFAKGLGASLLVFFGAGAATVTFGFKIAGTGCSPQRWPSV
jgi:hypothetical protein